MITRDQLLGMTNDTALIKYLCDMGYIEDMIFTEITEVRTVQEELEVFTEENDLAVGIKIETIGRQII